LPVEMVNAPTLSIAAGASTKGTLQVQANAEGSRVHINGRQAAGSIQHGKWSVRLEPGEYKVRLKREGYEDTDEQTVTILAGKIVPLVFDLKQAASSAFLRIIGGTPEAEVWVDDQKIGMLDTSGALDSTPVKADVELGIRIQKEGFEKYETRRRARAGESIAFSGAEA